MRNMLRKSKLQEIIRDRGLARLGDSILNFLYSIAKTKASGLPTGGRVPNKVLVEALRSTEVCKDLSLRGMKDKGDVAEALIAYAWLNGVLTLDEAVKVLSSYIKETQCGSLSAEQKQLAKGIGTLLNIISGKLK